MYRGVLDATRRDEARCDARSTNARGHKCDCSSAGDIMRERGKWARAAFSPKKLMNERAFIFSTGART